MCVFIVYWNILGGSARQVPSPCPPSSLLSPRLPPLAGLTVVESLMMAVAAIVPHYLMTIAGGAGIMGMFMLVW